MHLHDLTRLSLRHPRATLALLAVVTLALAPGLPKVKPAYGYRVLIGDDHPAVRALDSMIEKFGGGLPVQIGWSCDGSDVCSSVSDPDSLRMADDITRFLQSSEGIRVVRGPANTPVLTPSNDGFEIRTLVEEGRVAPDLELLLDRIRHDPLWQDRIFSRDGRVAAIELQPRDTQDITHEHVVNSIEHVLESYRARGIRFRLSGDSVETVIGGRALSESTARLVPLTVAAIFLMLLLLSHSLLESVVAIATMGVAYVWTFGFLGWLGWPQDGVLEVLAPLILVFGVCEGMHYLSRDSELRASGLGNLPRSDSLLSAAKQVVWPCFFTALTTAAAFFSFTLSRLDTFIRFGAISCFAVIACYLLTFSLLPILAAHVPAVIRSNPARRWEPTLSSISSACERRAREILLFSSALLAVFGFGWVAYLRVDTSWIESWGEESELVQSIQFLMDAGLRSRSLEIDLVLPDAQALYQPKNLETVERIESALQRTTGIEGTTSVLVVLRRINRLLHDDDPAYERIGRTPEENAQLVELISINEPELLGSWLGLDRRSLRISIDAPKEPSYRNANRIIETVPRILDDILPDQWEAHITGELAITNDWIRDVQDTQIRSFPASVLLVFAQLVWFFRSIPLATAATLPTLIPVVITLGGMGWLGMSLDVGRTMIASIIVGIGVDHSIHLLDAYQKRRVAGMGSRVALREAMQQTGRPIIISTMSLALGFLTLLGSAWQTISSFGFFVSAAMIGALLATVFVVPSLILVFTRDLEEAGA